MMVGQVTLTADGKDRPVEGEFTRKLMLAQVDRLEFDRTAAALEEYLLAKSSARQATLLRYLITEELEGRGDRIKAYSIAQDVFGKDVNFDSSNNSLIRVEVHRLRATIQNFYQRYEGSFRYVLLIPTGSYRVQVEEVREDSRINQRPDEPAVDGRQDKRRWVFAIAAIGALLAATVYFASHYFVSNERKSDVALARCPEGLPLVHVQFAETKPNPTGRTIPHGDLQMALATVVKGYPLAAFFTDKSCDDKIYYDLILDIQHIGGRTGDEANSPRYRVAYKLLTRKTKVVAATGDFENGVNEPSDRLPIIIAKVVNHLFDRFGLVVWDYIRDTRQENGMTNYECLASIYRFVSVSTVEDYHPIAECVQSAGKDDGLKAYLLSMHAAAMHYLIAEKMDYKPQPTMVDVEAALAQAEAIDPICRDCLYAKTRMLRYSNKSAGAEMTYYLNQMEKYWPYDALLFEHAALLAGPYLGQWDRAEVSFARAKATIGRPDEFPYYSINRAIFLQDKASARKSAQEVIGVRAPIFAVEVVAAAQIAGDSNLIDKAKKYARDIDINTFEDANKVALSAGYEPRLTERLQKNLAQAYGRTLPVAEPQ